MGKDKNSDIIELSGIINRSFSDVSNGYLINKEDVHNLEELKKYLSAKIKVFLEEKYNTLINILYRIDIDDKKIEEIFLSKEKDKIPDIIADLIIERQLQKIYFRKIYKEGNL